MDLRCYYKFDETKEPNRTI